MPANGKLSPIYATGNMERVGGKTRENRNYNCKEKRRQLESRQDEERKEREVRMS